MAEEELGGSRNDGGDDEMVGPEEADELAGEEGN